MSDARDESKKTDEARSSVEKANHSVNEAQRPEAKLKRPDTDSYVSTRPQNELPIREQKVEQARRKIEAGDYDSPEILDAIVEKLVDAFTG